VLVEDRDWSGTLVALRRIFPRGIVKHVSCIDFNQQIPLQTSIEGGSEGKHRCHSCHPSYVNSSHWHHHWPMFSEIVVRTLCTLGGIVSSAGQYRNDKLFALVLIPIANSVTPTLAHVVSEAVVRTFCARGSIVSST